MTKAAPTPEPTNLPAVSDDDFTAALRAAGFLGAASLTDFHRIKVVGQNFVYNDEIIASYNAKTKEPALYVRIAGPIEEYQSFWFEKDGKLANAIDRPLVAGMMCKSHFNDPNEARKIGRTKADSAKCDECPVMPFIPKEQVPPEAKGQKCSWKADIDVYILDKQEDGTLAQTDNTLYTMSLPTTAVIEFKGSTSRKADPLAGSVSDHNFMVKLGKLGVDKWGEGGLLRALTYYNAGGVVAEVRPLPASSNDGAFNYNVISFNPIDILELEEAPALPGPTNEDDEEVPF